MNRASSTIPDRPIPGPVSAAWSLLLAASSVNPIDIDLTRMRTLVENPIDWDALLRLTDDHGTASLVYQNLLRVSADIPAHALESLRQRYEKNVHRSLLLVRELFRILDCGETLGVELIPYKGPVLSELYYGDIAARQSGDIDIFVREHDVEKIKSAVKDLGYVPRMSIPENAAADYLASGYECTFDSPIGQNVLELQWAAQPHFYAVDFDMHGLFARAVEVTVAGRRLKTAAPEDLLVVLAIHAAKHQWARLIWLCDIVQIAKQENLDWEQVQWQAGVLGVKRILHVTLLLAQSLLGAGIPSTMEAAVITDQSAHRLANDIANRLISGVRTEEQQFSYFWRMMHLRERRTDRIRFLGRFAFTPGPGEWQAVRLPRWSRPFYRVVRMARLAARFARR